MFHITCHQAGTQLRWLGVLSDVVLTVCLLPLMLLLLRSALCYLGLLNLQCFWVADMQLQLGGLYDARPVPHLCQALGWPFLWWHHSNGLCMQAVMGTLVKRFLAKQLGLDPAQIYHCAVMPCYDKKLEGSRDDFMLPGMPAVVLQMH